MRVREYSQATFKDAHEHPPTYVSNQMIPAKWHTGCGSVGHEQVQPPVVCRLLSCGGRPHRHSMNGVGCRWFCTLGRPTWQGQKPASHRRGGKDGWIAVLTAMLPSPCPFPGGAGSPVATLPPAALPGIGLPDAAEQLQRLRWQVCRVADAQQARLAADRCAALPADARGAPREAPPGWVGRWSSGRQPKMDPVP